MAEISGFDALLDSLHSGGKLTDTESANNYIEITSGRRFLFPTDFDKTIAYEGDVNS
jgi:hypothetical protein